MSSAVKKTTFDEYRTTLSTMLKHIDKQLEIIKNRQKNLSVYKDYDNYKEFLRDIERTAVKKTVEELTLGETTVKDRWHVLTLPPAVFFALEQNEISFSKAKLLTTIHFDFNSESDNKVAEQIVNEIKKDLSNDEVKTIVKNRTKDIWNPSDIRMIKIAEQHGITQSTKC
jgi:hypothetical protein